jgi:hypothetical protein
MSIIPVPRAVEPIDRLVWRSSKSDAILNDSTPMTFTEVIEYARTWSPASRDFQVNGNRVRWVSGIGTRCEFEGHSPVPADPHAVIDDVRQVLLELPLSDKQGLLLIEAMRAAVDRVDPAPVLLRLVATMAGVRS